MQLYERIRGFWWVGACLFAVAVAILLWPRGLERPYVLTSLVSGYTVRWHCPPQWASYGTLGYAYDKTNERGAFLITLGGQPFLHLVPARVPDYYDDDCRFEGEVGLR